MLFENGTRFAPVSHMTALEAFGPNLRRIRLRRGISLDELSARTNVNAELWEAMEHNDFSRWPTGLAARAYVRDYATIVGIDPDETVDEFCRAVPHGDRRREPLVRGAAELLRHDLAWEEHLPPDVKVDRRSQRNEHDHAIDRQTLRAVASLIDLLLVTAAASVATTLLRSNFWTTVGVVGLLYHAVSMALLGSTPSAWAIDLYISANARGRHGDAMSAFRRLVMHSDTPTPDGTRAD
jgi:transcriptional regulator with XRE-family HTH domain